MSEVIVATFNVKKLKLEQALSQKGYSKPVVVRMGGIMSYEGYPVQINSVLATKNCIDKKRSKEILIKAGLPTLPMYDSPIAYPFVMKGIIRSRGSSVFMVDNENEFAAYKKVLCRAGYYIEPFFPYTSEYRLHCTQKEVFFAVKKQKDETHTDEPFINAQNHTNYREFVKPRLWNEIKEASMQALKVHGLDFACVDVGYNSAGKPHEFVIHELNTSPELRPLTFNHYITALDSLIKERL